MERFYFCNMLEQNISDIYSKYLTANQIISTDTRKILPGCLFFALRGENFNGNVFAKNAIILGAAYAIVDDKALEPNEQFIFVDNVLETLQQLANYHRKQLHIKVIAITGSNGKTTTKELVNSILSQKYKTYATQGNLNNHIGVPLTLLSLTVLHEFAIVEMGANHQKEIEVLCKIAEPDYGMITNIGKAHLEGFGGIEGVKKGKGELYDFLKKNNRFIFINEDNNVLLKMCGDYNKIIRYGTTENLDCKGQIENSSPFLKISWQTKNNSHQKEFIQSNLTGAYNFENILSAVCIGNYFGVESYWIKKGIENYFPSNQRSQVVVKNTNTLVLDYYNANPTSMEASLLNFDANYPAKKIIIIGDMLELGNESEAEHLYIIQLIKKLSFDQIILVGKRFEQFSNQLNATFFETSVEAKHWLQKQNVKNTSVLIKGSRGLKLEIVTEAFT